MCYSKNSSLVSFIIGILSSILLIFYGNKKYVKENLIVGLFLIFVSFMQFFDYFIWLDINNKKGLNYISTLIAPLFNHSQPSMLYILSETIYKKNNIYYLLLNLIYFIYVIIKYIQFISNNNNLITSKKYGHLYWKWKNNFNYYFYFFIFIFNIFTYIPLFYGIMFFLLGLFTLIISIKYFRKNIGELWCYLIAFTPLIILFISYII
jgi:hypothetical protein